MDPASGKHLLKNLYGDFSLCKEQKGSTLKYKGVY